MSTRVANFRERYATFPSVYRRLILWIVLLENRLIYAGGETTTVLATLSDDDLVAISSVNSTCELNPTAMALDAILQPARHFLLMAMRHLPRIIALDEWHKKPGTISVDHGILTDGCQIKEDLERLWQRRPLIFNALEDTTELKHIFQLDVSKYIVRVLRDCLSNFHALSVYLHRTAFFTYPATDELKRSVSNIIRLAQDQAVDDSISSHMLWPLFMAGTECDTDERTWILSIFERKSTGTASQVARLLEELVKRQERRKSRAGARQMKRQLFGSDFVPVF